MSSLSRRQARRQALVLLFQWDVTGEPLGTLYGSEADPYAREVAEAVLEHAEELDAAITAAAEGWTADRLGTIERNVLRIALHELGSGQVPDEVAIDEAVTLAKLEATRAELERLTEADESDRAIEVLAELAELAKQVETELQRARREADARA